MLSGIHMDNEIIYSDTIPGGRHWSMLMRAGNVLRLIDEEGGANVGMLLYNSENTLERYNMPDTLKGQHTFRLTKGNCLYSDMGRVLCSIIEDTAGWHDTATGTCNSNLVEKRWGHRSYQEARNDYIRNGRDSFLIELGKYGLGKRDLAANINFFSRIETDLDGNLIFGKSASAAAHVDLRFEMNTIVIFHTCPHPLNPASTYPSRPVTYEIRRANPVAINDACRTLREENERAFTNTLLYRAGGDT